MIAPSIKKAFDLKKSGDKNFSKAIVASLGAKELSLGVWVDTYRGMADKGLRTSVGGRVGQMFESGAVHQVAIDLQKHIISTAKKYQLEVATRVTEALKNLAAATASVVAVVTLSMAQFSADEYPKVVKVYEDHNPKYQEYVSDVGVVLATLQANTGVVERQQITLDDLDVSSDSLRGEFVNEQDPSSEFENIIRKAIDDNSRYIAKEGDSIWKISASITNKALGGAEYALNEIGDPSEWLLTCRPKLS